MTTNGKDSSALNINELLNRALAFHQTGNFAEAEKLYDAILSVNPNHAFALHYLGVIFDQYGDWEKAIELIGKSIAINPNDAEAYNNIGLAYKAKGEWQNAIRNYQHALKLDGNYPEAMYNLGMAMHNTENYEQAMHCFTQALRMNPDYAEIYCSMGRTQNALGNPQLEIDYCRKALALKPSLVEAHLNMGVAFAEMDNIEAAQECLQKALDINPNYIDALFNMSVCLQEQNKTQEAETVYRSILAKQPKFFAALHNISSVLQDQGKKEEAGEHLKQAIASGHSNAIQAVKAKLALLTSPIFLHADAIAQERENIVRSLQQLQSENCEIGDAFLQVGTINFYHAFHGENDKNLNTMVADFFLKASPSLGYRAAHVDTPHAPQDKIRIGFISDFFKEHTIAKFMRGIIEHLPRDRFEVTMIQIKGAEDAMSLLMKTHADYVISIPKNLEKAREEIASHALDILFYSDIGMESFTSFLAYSKLARVQCVGWGHPDTSGVPAVDYFLSQTDIETEDAQGAYSEQLIKLHELPTYYYAPSQPTTTPDKATLGLPEGKRIYLCPQSLFKFHPDFDAMIRALLEKDKDGVLVLIEGKHKHWSNSLKERFAEHIGAVAERILFVPRMPMERFLQLLQLADCVLDPIHFGGGNTSYEAFALGIPIVTLPGAFMRGRVTYGCYKKMGVMELVARTKEEYVELAFRLANDSVFHARMSKDIAEKSSVLYENSAIIHELSDFFTQAIAAHGKGETITKWPAA